MEDKKKPGTTSPLFSTDARDVCVETVAVVVYVQPNVDGGEVWGLTRGIGEWWAWSWRCAWSWTWSWIVVLPCSLLGVLDRWSWVKWVAVRARGLRLPMAAREPRCRAWHCPRVSRYTRPF